MNRFTSVVSVSMFVVTALFLTACGKHDGEAGTQVVARVNGKEISIHQLNYQMSRQGQVPPDQMKVVAKQILDRLVDQQLLVQKSLEAKLDRDPRVLLMIEETKREILAQAYIEQLIASAKKPSTEEVKEFYDSHPELFANRRIYSLQELAVEAGRDKLPEIEAGIRPAHNMTEVSNWLKQQNYKFSYSSSARATEQLPLELLPKLRQMKEGEVVLLPNPESINILMMSGFQEQPVSLEKARPLIEQYILNQHKSEIAKQFVESLRKESKIEYLGTFASGKSAAGDQPAQMDKPEGKLPEATPKEEKSEAEHMDKGVSGL